VQVKTAGAQTPEQQGPNMAHRETFETFNNCKIRLMRGGHGAPLLFLHGGGGAPLWLPFMESLSQRFDVIVPEHPGYGGSDTPDWLDNVGDLAYFYLDVIEALGLAKVHLVGTSLGGWIAAEIAVRSCARLSTLTLSAAVGIHVKGVSKGDLFMWSREQLIRNLYHDQALADAALAQPVTDDVLMTYAKNQLASAKLGWQPRLYNPHLYKWLHRISVPTLLVWGDDDKLVPLPYAPAYAALIPGARLHVIEKCGHVPHVERADEFVNAVTDFIGSAA
jgi:pimeloyl-ACP methyl ester carboxylesterase